jgi:DNA topoisomerase-1
MTKQSLVIVESPTKAKTIRKFLPKNFLVEASMGHVRDLPQSASEIPEKYKKEEWAKIGVNVDNDFEPLYVVPKGKTKVIQELKKKLEKCDEVFLATDEDREGESISWHLMNVLKPKVPVKRMVFHEITKKAIENALKDVRDIDLRLVRAQETRRILDRLVGYTLSPLLWKKIAYGLSAGRVQSAGLRLIVQRERERMQFVQSTYWDLLAELNPNTQTSAPFKAKLISLNSKKIATGKDFDETTGKLKDDKTLILLDESKAYQLCEDLKTKKWIVKEIEEKSFQSKPAAPFITSTLQQEANRKLGFSARETMRIAQTLYEQGFITYMRTDSPNLSQEAIEGARNQVLDLFGKEYLSSEPRQYSSKSKSAQEAHEAIRPAGSEFKHPRETGLSGKELALYEMIWMRTLATQMAEAQKLSVSVKIEAGDAMFMATGTRILFPGYLRAYVESQDDPEQALEEQEIILPKLEKGQELVLKNLNPVKHETKPPARYTEASLVQKLEKEGVGRPSTYATIIDTIIDRGYVRKVQNALVPTFTGFAVVQLLEQHFQPLVDLGFTSKMEESLDEIAEGKLEWLPYLKEFYLGKNGLKFQVEREEKKIDPEISRTVNIPNLDKNIQIKIGRYGPYLVQEEQSNSKTKNDESAEHHATIPEDIAPADLNEEKIKELIEQAKKGPTPLGIDPQTKLPVYCLIGRYGPYVQLGEVSEQNPKPKRAALLKGMDPKTLTLEDALKVLSLPRELGVHPKTGKPIIANQGRFGPYIMHDGDFRSLKKGDDLFTIDLNRALEILSEEKKNARQSSKIIKELGEHPETKKIIQVLEGRYGPYIKYDKKNITLPKELNPSDLTLNQALEVIAQKISTEKTKKNSKKKT